MNPAIDEVKPFDIFQKTLNAMECTSLLLILNL